MKRHSLFNFLMITHVFVYAADGMQFTIGEACATDDDTEVRVEDPHITSCYKKENHKEPFYACVSVNYGIRKGINVTSSTHKFPGGVLCGIFESTNRKELAMVSEGFFKTLDPKIMQKARQEDRQSLINYVERKVRLFGNQCVGDRIRKLNDPALPEQERARAFVDQLYSDKIRAQFILVLAHYVAKTSSKSADLFYWKSNPSSCLNQDEEMSLIHPLLLKHSDSIGVTHLYSGLKPLSPELKNLLGRVRTAPQQAYNMLYAMVITDDHYNLPDSAEVPSSYFNDRICLESHAQHVFMAIDGYKIIARAKESLPKKWDKYAIS